MILTLIPQWGRPEAAVSVHGDVLTIGGMAFDLSAVPEGGEGIVTPGPGQDHLIVGPVTRSGGTLHVTVIAHLGPDAAPDQPDAPWVIEATDGPVAIPVVRIGGIAE